MNTRHGGWRSAVDEGWQRVSVAISGRFGIDSRALAVFRISLGLLLIVDLLLRSRHIVAFYTDAGVLPRSTLYQLYPASRFSLHALSGSLWAQVALFCIAGISALALVMGYRTRLATLLSLLLLTSLHIRNPLVLNGGDVLLRRLLFWGIFLPLGKQWSFESTNNIQDGNRIATMASAALLVQVVLVYTVTGLFKLRGTRWLPGTMLRFLFHVDQLSVFLGDIFAEFPLLLRWLTWIWLVMVLSSALLILLTGWPRILLLLMFSGFHVGMLLTMKIGIFPLVSLVALIPFLPERFWDILVRHLPDEKMRSTWMSSLQDSLPNWPPAGYLNPGIGIPAPSFNLLRLDLLSIIVAILLASSLMWNAMGLGYVGTPDRLAAVRDPANHQWDMFARGHRNDGWFVAPGELESGERIDAWYQSSVSWDRPPYIDRTYPSARWLKYSVALRGSERLQYRFADFLCWRWNSEHGDDLTQLTVFYNKVHIGLNGPERTERIALLKKPC